ncbi:MAG: 30S ribosomal protein S4e [Candidatus Methanofastidiosa archaeon]|nr:30S ribosomal protein S4e [Candidatus Methanofastidiosa archaeon]
MGRKGEGKGLKREKAPRQWKIPRKQKVWSIRNRPGPHSSELSVPITFILRDYLGYAKNVREVKRILSEDLVLVNGKSRRDYRYRVGVMDVVEIPRTEEYYRIVPNYKGNLILHPITKEEKDKKLYKVRDVTLLKGGKYQLNFHDGNNMVSDQKYETYQSVIVDMTKNEIVESIPLQEGSLVLIVSGKNVSKIGKIVDIRNFGMNPDAVTLESPKGTFQTLKDYVIAIGREDTPLISLPVGE